MGLLVVTIMGLQAGILLQGVREGCRPVVPHQAIAMGRQQANMGCHLVVSRHLAIMAMATFLKAMSARPGSCLVPVLGQLEEDIVLLPLVPEMVACLNCRWLWILCE